MPAPECRTPLPGKPRECSIFRLCSTSIAFDCGAAPARGTTRRVLGFVHTSVPPACGSLDQRGRDIATHGREQVTDQVLLRRRLPSPPLLRSRFHQFAAFATGTTRGSVNCKYRAHLCPDINPRGMGASSQQRCRIVAAAAANVVVRPLLSLPILKP